MMRKFNGAIRASIAGLLCALLVPAAKADDDDPHAEYHPGDIPTKKSTPPKQAEKDRKSKYDDLEMNKWPPDLWPRDKSDKDDKPD